MSALTLDPRMAEAQRLRVRNLRARLSSTWAAECELATALRLVADMTEDDAKKRRLLVWVAFCRAHAARILARLNANGRALLPIRRESETVDGMESLLGEFARLALTYQHLAQEAREVSDLSAAWMCELNATECRDALIEFGRM